MAASLLLEDFNSHGTVSPGEPPAPAGPDPAEAERLAAYEEGYRAGWDDAARAEAETQDRIGAEFARTLQEIGFTFHEARAQVVAAMEPLLAQMVGTLLPGLAEEALLHTIRETMGHMIAEAGDAPLELVVAPPDRMAAEKRLLPEAPMPLAVIEDEALAPGQAQLRAGRVERHVDLSGALDRIRAAARDFQGLSERTREHG